MKLVRYNKYFASTVNTEGLLLKHQGIVSYSAAMQPCVFPAVYGLISWDPLYTPAQVIVLFAAFFSTWHFDRGTNDVLMMKTLWPNDVIWRQRSGSATHYLNQCWLFISEVLWHSPESNLTVSAQVTIPYIWKLHSWNDCQEPMSQYVASDENNKNINQGSTRPIYTQKSPPGWLPANLARSSADNSFHLCHPLHINTALQCGTKLTGLSPIHPH